MATCPNCGTQVQGNFCARCGTAVNTAPPPQNPYPGQQPPYNQPPQYGQQPPYGQPAAAGGLEENVASALCYVLGFITGILFLVLEPYNKNRTIRFHAFQSIFFNLGAFVLNIVLTIIFAILRGILPFGIGFVFSLLSLAVGIGIFGVWLLLMYKAYNRERFKVPIIGDLAEKQA